jgi:cob(I)alamin adenosyltransferase
MGTAEWMVFEDDRAMPAPEQPNDGGIRGDQGSSGSAGNLGEDTGLDAAADELGSGGMEAPERDSEAYQRRMERRRLVQRQRVEARQQEKGLVLVFTGEGKGKTTAALGLVLRMLGHGERVAVIQFIKGGWQPGEAAALQRFGDDLHFQALGEGFTWETQDRERDRQAVAFAWSEALRHLQDPERKLVVLDEVNVALKLGYLSLGVLLEGLRQRPPLTHVALTGRGAPAALLEAADLVTEMRLVRHPFREQGVRAQRGIEY